MTTLSTDPPASRYRRMISKGASGVLWGWKLTPHLTCGCNSPTATIALRSKSETFENSVFVIWFYLFIWYLVFDTLNKNKCFIDFICLLNFIIFLKNVCYLCLLRMLHRALGNLCITRDVIDWDDDDRYLFVFKKRLSGKLPRSFKHWLNRFQRALFEFTLCHLVSLLLTPAIRPSHGSRWNLYFTNFQKAR